MAETTFVRAVWAVIKSVLTVAPIALAVWPSRYLACTVFNPSDTFAAMETFYYWFALPSLTIVLCVPPIGKQISPRLTSLPLPLTPLFHFTIVEPPIEWIPSSCVLSVLFATSCALRKSTSFWRGYRRHIVVAVEGTRHKP